MMAMQARRELNICIGGEAGQGLLTMGRLLSEALARSGHAILVSQTYHSRVRGGHNTYAVRCGNLRARAPRRTIDLLVALNAESVELHGGELADDGLLLADSEIASGGTNTLGVPYRDLAGKNTMNTAALGVVIALAGLDPGLVEKLVTEAFAGKEEALAQENREALEKGFAWGTANRPAAFGPLAEAAAAKDRLLMTGNDAIALGALSAGLRFCSFYPMTPATSIILAIIARADKLGVVCEQAEDEIAAVNMALGASYAGAPSLVATSGGGFALMTEGLSLAAMTETPLLLVVAQRPGPATGLPTRTEQGDLEFVLHAGHGEFPRAVLAPTTVEECFALAQKALHLAEKSQGPVILLTDQYFADSLRDIDRASLPTALPVKAGVRTKEENAYRRYRLTESGLSPRRLPGIGQAPVGADSDEHDEAGHITEDLAIRSRMVEKRLAKLDVLRQEIVAPHYEGDDEADLLLVCWGSTRGAALEAADILRRQGRSIAVLSFAQVWPLAPEQFLHRLRQAKRVVAVEGNATRQFSRLLGRETGFFAHGFIGRCDGLAFTADYILDRLSAADAQGGPHVDR